ncbi:hypothetical protein A5620_09100 [Mycobacterium colombiense]|nr:hypothetical protein A5620_09100 [Mycobacterium colombiense]
MLAGAAVVGCGNGSKTSSATTSSAASSSAGHTATPTSTPAQPSDYTRLLIAADDVVADEVFDPLPQPTTAAPANTSVSGAPTATLENLLMDASFRPRLRHRKR